MTEVLKVTDPRKIVTDIVLLSTLAKQGIDKDFVEFFQDYALRSLGKGHSPYAKFYRDLKSNKRFMVVSGLPMIDGDGVKIEAGWRLADINYFAEKNNLFRAKVQGTQVEITIRNDQPDGRKAGDKLTFKPQLYLDGKEQIPSLSVLLPVDPVNSNYTENTLEWDYGICKRRLRIIEGSILGSWVFPVKPKGEVRIKYNQTGDYKLRLGQFKVGDDEEVITPEGFDRLAESPSSYPVTISDSATFYPDAHVESTSVDGGLDSYVDAAGDTWAVKRDGSGQRAWPTRNDFWVPTFQSGTTSPKQSQVARGVLVLDISGLPATAVISAATLSIYGQGKSDALSCTPNINVYSSSPASNTDLVTADFNIANFGSTAFCDTPITYANWIYANPFWNDFAFNAAGIAFVQAAADGANIAKLGLRNVNYDIANTAPPWVTGAAYSHLNGYCSDQGNGYKPKLVVTYTVPSVFVPRIMMF